MPDTFATEILADLSAMRRYARSLTRDDHLADDLVQDALLRALEKRSSFRPDGSRKGWLLTIVHNIFISGLRRRKAEASRDERFAETLLGRLEPEQEQVAYLNHVARAFAALPEHQRDVLHLVAVEGLSYQQVARILDIPIGTVMSRLSRARSAIRRQDDEGSGRQGGLRIVGGRDDD